MDFGLKRHTQAHAPSWYLLLTQSSGTKALDIGDEWLKPCCIILSRAHKLSCIVAYCFVADKLSSKLMLFMQMLGTFYLHPWGEPNHPFHSFLKKLLCSLSAVGLFDH